MLYLWQKRRVVGVWNICRTLLNHCISWALVNTICCFATNGVLLGLPGCLMSCYACGYRRSLRAKYNLQEAPCGDFVTLLLSLVCHLPRIQRDPRMWQWLKSSRYEDGYYRRPLSSNHGIN